MKSASKKIFCVYSCRTCKSVIIIAIPNQNYIFGRDGSMSWEELNESMEGVCCKIPSYPAMESTEAELENDFEKQIIEKKRDRADWVLENHLL